MKYLYKFLVPLFCAQLIVTPGHSVTVGGTCVLNSSVTSEQCDAGLYCNAQTENSITTYTCTKCPDTHPDSSKGQNNSINKCYKTCDNKEDFANGTWAPDNKTVYYNNKCTYTNSNNITCNNTTDKCDGYHQEVNTCVSNRKTCTNGFQIYDSTAGGWSTCLITTCTSSYHLENTATQCGQTYGTCVSNSKSCATDLTCESGTISGNATWNNDKYEYDTCKCTTDAGLTYGVGTKTCTWDGTKTNGKWSNCEINITSCNAGYWIGDANNPTDCVSVGRGYYSPANDTGRKKCPAGSTTDTETCDQKTDCHMVGGTTKFCDTNNNCFTLPDGIKIHYKTAQ